ncbi:hypothetical protein J6590_027128 [Homalodisca vitripennis]|nr:hypothetical protein J6590_027128 [Homalodisca vitripennis]
MATSQQRAIVKAALALLVAAASRHFTTLPRSPDGLLTHQTTFYRLRSLKDSGWRSSARAATCQQFSPRAVPKLETSQELLQSLLRQQGRLFIVTDSIITPVLAAWGTISQSVARAPGVKLLSYWPDLDQSGADSRDNSGTFNSNL